MYIARGMPGVALQLRIAVDPVIDVLLFDGQGFGFIRNLPVALHDAE